MMISDLHTALFQAAQGDRVKCLLCPHGCTLGEGETGLCGVRRVQDHSLRSLSYGRPVALSVDPIEKKPLFHFLPASPTFSYATAGCNLACRFCQNYSISQAGFVSRPTRYHPPEKMVAAAVEENCRVIAHTYTEPTVYFEYALDIARLGSKAGMKNIFVSNGFTSPEPLEMIAPHLDGINVDLKAFSDETYRKICRGRLQPVLDTIALLHKLGVWVEVTTLIVPGMNDSEEELRSIASFIASVSPSMPWHVSRFHPDFDMLDRGVTPAATVEAAVRVGTEEGLEFVYSGNLPANPLEDTLCPGCGTTLIKRRRFTVDSVRLSRGMCPDCSCAIAGIWK